MANPEWRAAHTSAVAPDFVEGFYKHSRLHYLSTWKAELKNLVQQAQEEVENWSIHESIGDTQDMAKSGGTNMSGRTSPRGLHQKGKERKKPELEAFARQTGCHLSLAREHRGCIEYKRNSQFKLRSQVIWDQEWNEQGRRLCPDLMTIPYEFEKYKQLSLRFYTILMRHADDIQAVSVDEALIEVTPSVSRCAIRPSSLAFVDDPARSLAEQIRSEEQVAKVLHIDVIGIAENIQLARIATRKAKPAGSFHLKSEDVEQVLAPLDIDDLHGFGHSTRQKANEKLGVTNLSELAKKSKAALCDALGKTTGETLYNSVSCDINYGIRFENNDQAKAFIHQMAEEVSRRLNAINMCGRSLTLKIMKCDPSAPVEPSKFMGHGICETFSKHTLLSSTNGRATSDPKDIGEHAWSLLGSWGFDPKELRGIGIQIQKLDTPSPPDATDPGQVKLPFQARSSKTNVQDNTEQGAIPMPMIITEPPSPEDPLQNQAGSSRPLPTLDLPSFSQVDKDVFDVVVPSPVTSLLSPILCPPSCVSHLPSPISHLPSPISHLPSPISHLPSPISHLPSPISHLPSPISHLPSPISHLPSPISHLPSPSPISHLPSPISHLPSPISHLPSPISHLPSPISHLLLCLPSCVSCLVSPVSRLPSPVSFALLFGFGLLFCFALLCTPFWLHFWLNTPFGLPGLSSILIISFSPRFRQPVADDNPSFGFNPSFRQPVANF
ncbi:hypothetical protein BDR07DRAFT_1495300 [Suillus spraguei]|nr:hypothetical protein BDR07DRAFT_1495300 [Suillus spraguei]